MSLLLALPLAAAAPEHAAQMVESGGIGFFEGLFLGLIQGVTEFIPVSSSGHLALGHMLGMQGAAEAARAFDVAVHAATLFAMMLYFRDEVVSLFAKRPRLIGLILLGCVPAAVAGVFGGHLFEPLATNAYVVGAAFVINGLFLIASKFFGIETKRLEDLRPVDAALVGFAQAVALIPGVSRSGITITSGLICGLRRTEAFVFSFLLGMPIIAGAAAYKLRSIGELAVSDSWHGLAVGFVAAFLAGLASVSILARLVRRRNLLPFGIYTLLLGIVVIGVKVVRAIVGG
jgi:undecaprenyl-diphosphatase